MAGVICLQGGVELTPPCRQMDADVVARAVRDAEGPVVSLAGAARVGSDHAGASDRVRRHYTPLAVEHGVEVIAAPDPRTDLAGTLEALTAACLVVLPGGSPASLRDVLTGEVRDRLLDLHAAGTALSGASAGAMVLCQRMGLPSDGWRQVDGLGLVPGLALVHWGGPGRGGGGEGLRWGLPEQGGVLIDGDQVLAVGQGTPSVRVDEVWREVPRDQAMPLPA